MILPDWPAPASVRSLMTTRAGGVSAAPWASFNLGDHVGDDPVHVAANRARLRRQLPAEPDWLRQVHSARVVELGRASVPVPEADAAFTREPGRVCAVLTADCLPVLFCDRAGSTVAAMQTPPADIIVWLGAAIGPQAFEVGDDVRDAFSAADPAAAGAFVAHAAPGKWLADIYALARIRLGRLGVTAIHGGGRCTFTESGHFYSYRRDGVTGRMASLIWRA